MYNINKQVHLTYNDTHHKYGNTMVETGILYNTKLIVII